MTIIIFEDEVTRLLQPLTLSRPVFELRCGVMTLRERVQALTGAAPNGLCRPHLAQVHGSGRWPLGLLSTSEPITLVNGRALSLDWLADLEAATPNTVFITEGSPALLDGTVLLGARLTPALASAVFFDLLHQNAAGALAELRRFAHIQDVSARVITFPWDLILQNGAQVGHDAALLANTAGWATAAERPPAGPGIVIHCPERVWLHQHARLDGPLVLDARDGPIIIDAAHIEPFSFIQGPTAIGRGALISSARIRAETSVGPVCRIGGEVEASIVQGYTNKHHDGFLGHAYLGEWVNIGAMTTNSDLKNTYGAIKMTIDGLGLVDSGQIKLGCFLADHVKIGIGMHLSGGAVIGTGSNLFGVHSLPKNIPPFTWGGEVFREYEIDRMIGVARKVMGRRKLELSEAQEHLLRDVFAQTRGARSDLVDTVLATDEAALRKAEAVVE